MRCAHCKAHDVTISHVKECSGVFPKQTHMINRVPGFQEVKLTPVERMRAAASKLPVIATARYAIRVRDFTEGDSGWTWEFYRVDMPQTGKWKGYTFVKRQASDELYPVPFGRALNVVEAIAETGARNSAVEYSRQIEKCSVCHRTLTVKASIERAMGPICYGKFGA